MKSTPHRSSAAAIGTAYRRPSPLLLLFFVVWLALIPTTATQAASIKVVATFKGSNGANPVGDVTFDSKGNAWGTATEGGASSDGVVWEIKAGTTKLVAVASFTGVNGSYPTGSVVFDSHKNLWGTTEFGGPTDLNNGVIWEIKAQTSKIIDVATFNGANGSGPYANVTFDKHGNLFGTASYGGPQSSDNGVVWEIKVGTTKLVDIAQFDGTNGYVPAGGIAIDSKGDLFGTVLGGGAMGNGDIWEIASGIKGAADIADFDYTDGQAPGGDIGFDSLGNLFGAALGGGASDQGTIFEYSTDKVLNAVVSPDVADGASPNGVTLDSAGDILGTAQSGGEGGDGVVWEIMAGTSTLAVRAAFNGGNGSTPLGDVAIDSHGNLWGTTFTGGSTSDGVIWEIKAAGAALETPSDDL